MKKETVNTGRYETATVTWISDNKGKFHMSFNDVQIQSEDEMYIVDREMTVKNSIVRVHSIFPMGAVATATEKILSIIDLDMEKLVAKSC